MRILRIVIILFIFVLMGWLASIDFTFASITDGTIDNTYKYAWSENTGWVNFGTSAGSVHVTDSGLSGYALSETAGWIYLGDIINDGEGNLSGKSWGENVGWIDFDPANGGVVINSSGEFTGSALGENIGWIIFSGDYKVKTDWRPQSARPACNNSSDDDGDGKIDYPSDPGCSSLDDTDETDPVAPSAPSGGGGMPSEWYNPPKSPEGGFSILINNDAEYTDTLTVALNLRGGPDTARMAIANFSDFRNAGQEPYQATKEWNLCTGRETCPEGEYKVYVKFYAPWGTASEVISDSIIYKKSIIAKIPEIIKKILEIFKPKPPEEIKPPEVPIEELVPKETPLAFQGKWQLLPSKPIREFVLAPLPKEIRALAEKFPELGETFEEIGISKITDVLKLKTVKLTLPGLREGEKIPTEIVFAKTGGQLIDFNIALSITEKGELEQRISTISGKPLQLVVKPDKPVKSVKGYVVFKSKKPRPTSFQFPFNILTASLIFANPVFAKPQEQPVRVEEKLVLLEFEYTDPDGDGIYTAEIQAPIVEGEYEIITVMDYEDPALGMKEIRLITVVDPEGYIYEKAGDKEIRIPGAIVSLSWLNPETKQYEPWPAKEYQQENPQITDITGKYSFLVPEGSYYLKIEAPGYLVYDGKPFQVKEGSGVHVNIGLKTKYWWLKIVDWKTVLLILVIILLPYNFYRDKIREKLLRKSKNL